MAKVKPNIQNIEENDSIDVGMVIPNLPPESDTDNDDDTPEQIMEDMYSIKTGGKPTEGNDNTTTYEKKAVNKWDVDDVVAWLALSRNGAFKKHIDIFRKNRINGKDLEGPMMHI